MRRTAPPPQLAARRPAHPAPDPATYRSERASASSVTLYRTGMRIERPRRSTPENAHAYCPDRAALRSCPAETLRRHRACRVLPHRGARRARPRCDAVRQRRLRHVGPSRGGMAARPAARSVDPRFDGAPYAPDRAGRPCRARIRRAALPPRLPAVLADVAPRHALRDDAARPPRPAGAAAGVRRVPEFAGRLDLEFAAQAAAAGRVGRHRVSRAARHAAHAAAAREARIPRVSRPDLSRKAGRHGDPHRREKRAAAEDRRRSTRPTPTTSRK